MSTIRLLNRSPVSNDTYLYDLIGGPAYGAALVGLLAGVSRWRRGKRVIVHPGYLLLYLAGIGALLDLGLTLAISLWGQPDPHPLARYFYHRQIIGYGLMLFVAIAAIVCMRRKPVWCLPLITLFLLAILQIVGATLILVHAWRPVIQQNMWLIPQRTVLPLAAVCAATTLAVATIDGFQSKEKRDWIHWVGVLVVVGMAAPLLLGWLMSRP